MQLFHGVPEIDNSGNFGPIGRHHNTTHQMGLAAGYNENRRQDGNATQIMPTCARIILLLCTQINSQLYFMFPFFLYVKVKMYAAVRDCSYTFPHPHPNRVARARRKIFTATSKEISAFDVCDFFRCWAGFGTPLDTRLICLSCH